MQAIVEPAQLPERIILHLDLNAFFAAVEERAHPEYAGKPVIVGADPKHGAGRGVVATCNYAARAFGVRSAMPISKAYRLCPEGIYVPVNYKRYTETSLRIMHVLRKHALKFQPVSIDEAYLDVSHLGSYDAAAALAKRIKDEIRAKEGLTCSVGIGPNLLIAKVASDFQKPDGLTVVPPDKAEAFLAPQDIGVLRGVGVKTKGLLTSMHITTVDDLKRYTVQELTGLFGGFGESLYWQARGHGETTLVEDWTAKSIGRERTFDHDTRDERVLKLTLERGIAAVHQQLVREKLQFRTVCVKVRYADFETHTKQRNLIDHVSNIEAIQKVANALLASFLKDSRKIRLIGVGVRGLKPC